MGLLLTPALADHRNGWEARLNMLATKLIAFTRETGVPMASLLVPTRADLSDNLRTVRTWVDRRMNREGNP